MYFESYFSFFASPVPDKCLHVQRNDDSDQCNERGSQEADPAVWRGSHLSLMPRRKRCKSNALSVVQFQCLVCTGFVTIGFCISNTERDPDVNSCLCSCSHYLASSHPGLWHTHLLNSTCSWAIITLRWYILSCPAIGCCLCKVLLQNWFFKFQNK